VLSKLFEGVLARFLGSDSTVDNHQFGFKAGHSTSLCTNVLKQTVDYYTSHGSYVFVCFIDFQKAFDKVNYWKLFLELLDDGIEEKIVKILAFWYSNQICFSGGKMFYRQGSNLAMELDRVVFCLRFFFQDTLETYYILLLAQVLVVLLETSVSIF